MRSIVLTKNYAYPRDALADWLMPNDFRPVAGHEFTFRTKPAPGFDGIVRAKVLEISPPERLVLAWKGGPLDTTVSFELVAVSSTHTRLTLVHEGFQGVSNLLPRLFLGGGWKDILGRKLPDHIASMTAG
jgi:uncharacterized protein YndB with AHSA1/START domain